MSKEANLENNATKKADISSDRAQKDIFKAIVYCLLLVLVVRSFIVEPFRIPSSSMVPTLQIGDHIFVSKFSYALSLPFTKFQFLTLSEPKRGDVVVFLWPRDESFHYVKRVIGLPGDRIQIKGRDVLVNGKEIIKTPISIEKLPMQMAVNQEDEEGIFLEEKIENFSHLIRHNKTTSFGHESRDLDEVIPPNYYFVMGDNRDDSSDSRSWGLVPKENIKGKAKLIWLSLDQVGAWNNLRKIRWGRCLKLIN